MVSFRGESPYLMPPCARCSVALTVARRGYPRIDPGEARVHCASDGLHWVVPHAAHHGTQHPGLHAHHTELCGRNHACPAPPCASLMASSKFVLPHNSQCRDLARRCSRPCELLTAASKQDDILAPGTADFLHPQLEQVTAGHPAMRDLMALPVAAPSAMLLPYSCPTR